MKFGVVTFPGSNCDHDMIDALRNDLGQEVIELWHKDKDLSMFSTEDCIVLPGGFSYGDYLRCGAIARFSPMMQSVIEFANKGGRVIGICNGFQILVEAGLLPGALLRNENQQFVCKNVYLKSENTVASLTKDITGRPLMIPVAHGEGRYYADKGTLEGLQANNQILFRYCDEFGNVVEEANPNGATLSIAGICNRERNVFGMMPHPERATREILGNTDGQLIFQSLINNN
ncbi:phosphoribosylformylglycinamidine synthase I [Chitinophaga sancti]|uniref:Phosphoribosylformylglycinamidine synthase subunit PurQ n=1 Tax=Chitinophaga sancti TaxID=1004 RepID=A0A1K1PE10_9BACT|nr:phosphoribosylformylglycinamidine synthase I [Chitinophaga sancti]WQD65806.1 phosphoribosylformylglycinamidine synthase I [Chitinophaga sancti]WQG88572.1 phosphoribosylformylglycinamidine synthase I [Chitinophaga sancti]SFW45815.1 phosphoribosylformylglycinamidine synthase [Chitinophaga sancti]